jgi:hypothetical protein
MGNPEDARAVSFKMVMKQVNIDSEVDLKDSENRCSFQYTKHTAHIQVRRSLPYFREPVAWVIKEVEVFNMPNSECI